MLIEEAGELTSFETPPTEMTLYMTAIQYSTGTWMSGPSSPDKNELLRTLNRYTGLEKVRIYAVRLPLAKHG